MKRNFHKATIIILAILGLVSGVFATMPVAYTNEQAIQEIVEIEPFCQPIDFPHYRVDGGGTILRERAGNGLAWSLNPHTELARISTGGAFTMPGPVHWINVRVLSGTRAGTNGWVRSAHTRSMGSNIHFCW